MIMSSKLLNLQPLVTMIMALQNHSENTTIRGLLKHIEYKHELLTFGYIRARTNIVNKIIPDPIINMCLIYDFLIVEYFEDFAQPLMEIREDSKTTTTYAHSFDPVLGASDIHFNDENNDIYTQKIKINSAGWEIAIGIDENERDLLDPYFHHSSDYNHDVYSNEPCILSHKYDSDIEGYMIDFEDQNYFYDTRDIVTMVANTDNKSVDFYSNDQHMYPCQNVVNQTYRQEDDEAVVTLESLSIQSNEQ